jgi:hypothetical protein
MGIDPGAELYEVYLKVRLRSSWIAGSRLNAEAGKGELDFHDVTRLFNRKADFDI